MERTRKEPRIQAATNNVYRPDWGLVLFCVTKAANTSIRRAVLRGLAEQHDPQTGDRWSGSNEAWVPTHRHPALNRTPLAEMIIDPRTRSAFKAVIVRNPFDRLVSCYTEKVLYEKKLGRMNVRSDMSFSEFVDLVCNTSDDEADIHVESQHRFFEWRGVVLADFIGSVENITEDWNVIRAQTSLPLESLGNYNQSPSRREYESYYTSELVRRVEKRYERDFELLGYEFGRAESRALPRVRGDAQDWLRLYRRLPRAVAWELGRKYVDRWRRNARVSLSAVAARLTRGR